MNECNEFFTESDLIYSYTRRQAIDDGVLIDLSEWARQTGFKIPVACTDAVWQRYVVPPDGTRTLGQSERGRVHDLLWMLWVAIKKERDAAEQLLYDVIFLNGKKQHETVTLKAVCGPGDGDELVLTIMTPAED